MPHQPSEPSVHLLPGPWRVGEFEIDLAARRVLRGGQPLGLGDRAFDLLVALASAQGRLVGAAELRAAVWQQADVAANNLRVQITHLRKLLAPDSIEYRPRQGYRLTWPVASAARPLDGTPGEPPPPVHAPEPLLPALGRDALLARLQEVLQPGRRITLHGPGGSGKTLLAQTIAPLAAPGFSDGVWWVDLAAHAEPDAVAAAVAAALQLPPGPDARARVADHLSARSLLLVLDTCEHLPDAVTRLCDAWLAAAPRVAVLATSRVPLKCAGEQLLPVGMLDLPARPTLADARASGALAVFEARVRSLDARFRLDDTNVATAVEICRRLDGLPFAIAVAAAQVPALGLAAVHDGLDDRLHWRASGSDHLASLHDTLDWSHGLLPEAAQRLLAYAGVFASGFTLEDLQAVLSAPALDGALLQRALRALVEHGLLLLEGGALRGSATAATYGLHDSVRLYARGRLAAHAGAAAAHAAHGRRVLARLADPSASTSAGHIAWPTELADAELSLSWAALNEPGLAFQLCAACSPKWRRLGWHARAWHHAGPLLARPVTPEDRLPRVDLMLSLCGIEFERDRLAEAEALARGALALLAPGETERRRFGLANSWIASVAALRGQWPEAEARYWADLAASRQAGDLGGELDALNNLGWVLQAAGRPNEARPLLHQALALSLAGDWARMVSHENLGELEAGVGRSLQAVYHLESVMVLARRLPDAYRLANAQALMALACPDAQLAGPVPAWLRECLAVARRQGYLRLVAQVCVGLARHRLAAGQPAEALTLLHAAQAALARGGFEATPLMTRVMAELWPRAEALLDPHAQAAARARGELLTVDEIVALAA